MQTLNYAQLTNKALQAAVTIDTVNFAMEGNIYEINSMENTQYPLIFISAVRPAVEHEDYFSYYLTLYYFDRLQQEVEEQKNADSIIIRSNGITALSMLTNMIRNFPEVLDVPFENQYTCFGSTFVFSDYCLGVYTEIEIKLPKTSKC
jgi:hypothetical protein